MDVDTFMNTAGGCGRAQLLIITCLQVFQVAYACINHLSVFTTYNPGWNCLQTQAAEGDDLNASTIFSTPNPSDVGNSTWVTGSCDVLSKCSDVAFDPDTKTLATKWSLICGDSWAASVILSVESAGLAVGSFVSGFLGDRLGRRRGLLLHILTCLVASFVLLFSTSWHMYAACRFVSGVGNGGLGVLMPVYAMELVPAKWRVLVISCPAWNIGTAAFSALMYALKDWEQVTMAMVVIIALAALSLIGIPESLRWLATHGKADEAKRLAAKFCKFNKVPCPEPRLLNFEASAAKNDEKKAKITLLFQRKLLKKTVLSCLTMFLIALSYMSLYFGIKNLHGNFYLNMIIFAVLSIPVGPFMPILTHRVGRRGGNLIFCTLASLISFSVVAVFFLVSDRDTRGLATTVMALIISVVLDEAWCLHMSHVGEIFPTSLRASVMATVRLCSQVGRVVAPFISGETQYTYFIMCGSFMALSICMLLCLPETLHKPMSDNISQMGHGKSRDFEGDDDFVRLRPIPDEPMSGPGKGEVRL